MTNISSERQKSPASSSSWLEMASLELDGDSVVPCSKAVSFPLQSLIALSCYWDEGHPKNARYLNRAGVHCFFLPNPRLLSKVALVEQSHSLLVPSRAPSILPENKPQLERGMVLYSTSMSQLALLRLLAPHRCHVFTLRGYWSEGIKDPTPWEVFVAQP